MVTAKTVNCTLELQKTENFVDLINALQLKNFLKMEPVRNVINLKEHKVWIFESAAVTLVLHSRNCWKTVLVRNVLITKGKLKMG